MRLTTDLFAYCEERLPSWNTISISGYHIREAGSSAAQELAFTLSNGIAYCEAAIAAGLSPDEFGERLSFFFNAHNHFFQEVAKFRAARRLWAEIMRERFGATNPRARALRFHAQTGGSTLTAQQPENNVVRVAIQALSAVCGGAQSIHTNSFDEALALRASCGADRAQDAADPRPRGGRHRHGRPAGRCVLHRGVDDELEEKARELIQRVDELGGAVAAIEQGFVQAEIDASAFRFQAEVESGEPSRGRCQPLRDEGEERIQLLQVDPRASGGRRRGRLVRAERDADAAARSTRRGASTAETDATCSRRSARR